MCQLGSVCFSSIRRGGGCNLAYLGMTNTEYHRQWRSRNRDRSRELARATYHRHRARYLEKSRQYRTPEVQAARRMYGRKEGARVRIAVVRAMGGHCVICGETDWRVLQINHLDGDVDHEMYNSTKVYRDLLAGRRSIQGLDLRCANCNLLYEYERGTRYKDVDLKALEEEVLSCPPLALHLY